MGDIFYKAYLHLICTTFLDLFLSLVAVYCFHAARASFCLSTTFITCFTLLKGTLHRTAKKATDFSQAFSDLLSVFILWVG